jgi:tetratricopeptide (TPR) repeat protein
MSHALTAFPALTLLALLSACSSAPETFETSASPVATAARPQELLQDSYFVDASAAQFTPVDIFALPPQITAWLDENIAGLGDEERKYRALRSWAFDLADQYEYNPEVTASLDELDDIGIVNCFSFSNLFVAAARHLNVSAEFQLVYTPPSWGTANQAWVLNQHVNVTGRVNRITDRGSERSAKDLPLQTGTYLNPEAIREVFVRYVVDLNTRIVVDEYRTEILTDPQVLALFYANKAAEALFADKLGLAYQYTKHAVQADPASATALNTLGVLYGRVEQTALARDAYLAAIAADADADSARSNLAALYRRMGEVNSASDEQQRLNRRRERNPYYHFTLGEEKLQAGQWEEALAHYRDAVRRKKDEQLFYLSQVQAHLSLGDQREAQRALQLAERHADRDNAERLAQLQQAVQSGTATGIGVSQPSQVQPAGFTRP